VRRASLVTILALAAVVAYTVYSSLYLGSYRCEICIDFEGRNACRTVEGATEEEARQGATTNVCALLSSGVTDTMRCARTPPARSTCTKID
jgi:hypothetical protein